MRIVMAMGGARKAYAVTPAPPMRRYSKRKHLKPNRLIHTQNEKFTLTLTLAIDTYVKMFDYIV